MSAHASGVCRDGARHCGAALGIEPAVSTHTRRAPNLRSGGIKSRWPDSNRHHSTPARCGDWSQLPVMDVSSMLTRLQQRRSALSYNGIIEAVRETEERKMHAKPKGGNYHGGSFRRLRRSGAPLCAVPLVQILPYRSQFRECRSITKMCFLYCACCAKSLSAEVCPYFSKSLTPTIDALPNDINTGNPGFIGNLILRFSINVKIYDRICALCSNDKAICPLCCLVLQR